VVSSTPLTLYPQGKRPWYPLDRRLGALQRRSGHGCEEKKSDNVKIDFKNRVRKYGLKLAQDMIRKWAFLNTVMKLWVSQEWKIHDQLRK
jgi:hypothetical protein